MIIIEVKSYWIILKIKKIIKLWILSIDELSESYGLYKWLINKYIIIENYIYFFWYNYECRILYDKVLYNNIK